MLHGEAFLFWGSAIGAALNIFTTWSISRHYRWGWLAALAVQPYWAAFGIASGQYGLALLAAIYSVLYIQGYRSAEQIGGRRERSGREADRAAEAGRRPG